HHLRSHLFGNAVFEFFKTLPAQFLIGVFLLSCPVAEDDPMIAVEVFSRLLIGILNGCVGCFVAEYLSNFINPFGAGINKSDIRTAKALTKENEISVVNGFGRP